MADIRLDALTKQYPGGTVAVNGLDLQIADGEFFALLGPSGCGKTTLLRTIAGLENATGGRLLIGGTDHTHTPAGKRDVAMVFQDYALFPHMDVADNIAYPLRIRGLKRSERRAKAAETGAGLGLSALMQRRPGQLSGGQQQRVALARAMACQPSVFLFDEPLSNLDARLRLEARTFLKRLQRELAVTTIFVTHDQAEALAMADRMAVMELGRIRQVGTPAEVFHRPANTFVANFIGSAPMNLLPGTVHGGSVRVAGRDLPMPDSAPTVPDGTAVMLGARPEYVTIEADGPGTLAGTVSIVENLGASALVTVEVPTDGGGSTGDGSTGSGGTGSGGSTGSGGTGSGGTGSDGTGGPDGPLLVQAMVTEGTEPEPGQRVSVVCQHDRSLLYDEQTGNLMDRDSVESLR